MSIFWRRFTFFPTAAFFAGPLTKDGPCKTFSIKGEIPRSAPFTVTTAL